MYEKLPVKGLDYRILKREGVFSLQIPIKMYSTESDELDSMLTTCVSVCVFRKREKKRDRKGPHAGAVCWICVLPEGEIWNIVVVL